MAITFVTGLLLLGSTAFADPPGNNGTVKVDAEPFDDAPNNEPHVGCRFQIDFYGYDEGDLFADVTFEAHPPTLPSSGDRVVLEEDRVFIGEDSNAGGGSLAGLDASRTYELDFGDITPHPKQGFHVYLTINAEGSQGADVKHKVFWSEGCEEVPPPSSSSSSSSSTTSTTMAGGGGESKGTSSSSTTAVGKGGALPFTGAGSTMPMLVAGLALLGLGALSVLVSRARRQSGT